ncbi:hypothetical protein FUAX_38740 (plasmid) [Fulvitalea axinellae]|uniref:Uncharacterized protein n=1 Tax=Fulvitalea axinellae TaxID=1182444 RepID=A0AAU9CTY3_9BACT|nr:hypothetical protein FUAX_38740 [Fulvitalea axinellae]
MLKYLATLILPITFCLNAFSQDITDEAVLLPGPSEWRYERIAFPIDFAPELDYNGYEELRFSPGMFKTYSDDFFSYAFAFKLDSISNFGQGDLRELLNGYYSGLTKSMSKGRRRYDPNDITVFVIKSPQEGRYTVKLNLVQYFTKRRRRLALNLDVMTFTREGDTYVYATASPLPVGAPERINLEKLISNDL